jgi:hypothetical protein
VWRLRPITPALQVGQGDHKPEVSLGPIGKAHFRKDRRTGQEKRQKYKRKREEIV